MAQFFQLYANTAITKHITCDLCSVGHIIMRIRISKRLLKKLCTAQLLSKAGYEQSISCVMLVLFPADRQRKDEWQLFQFQKVMSGRELGWDWTVDWNALRGNFHALVAQKEFHVLAPSDTFLCEKCRPIADTPGNLELSYTELLGA